MVCPYRLAAGHFYLNRTSNFTLVPRGSDCLYNRMERKKRRSRMRHGKRWSGLRRECWPANRRAFVSHEPFRSLQHIDSEQEIHQDEGPRR